MVGRPSFISSFRSFRGLPRAGLLALVLFALVELALAVAWRPDLVGAGCYKKYALSFDYAYAADFPRLFREGPVDRYYPSEYADMSGFALARDKDPQQIRVFVLGASVTRGGDVPPGAAYPEQLDVLLRARYPDQDWQVINLAASGFGTTRMLHVLRNMEHYQPDVIVVHPHGSNEYEDERDARYRAELHAGLNGVFLQSRLIVLLKKLQAAWLDPDPAPREPRNAEQLAGQDPENRTRWQATLVRNVEAIAALAEARGVPLFFVSRAARDEADYRGERVVGFNAPIRDRRHYVDVPSIFTGPGAAHAPDDLFLNWTHYTELGHRLVAEELCRRIGPGSAVYQELKRPTR
jgi:hypothetical protein